MNLDEQTRILRARAHLGLNAYVAMIEEKRDEIEAMMVARNREGFPEFGDGGWHKTPRELTHDAMEEAADGGNYMVYRSHALEALMRRQLQP